MKRTQIFLIASLCLTLTLSANLKQKEKPIMKGSDFCNEQVVELNIPAERLINNFRNFTLPINFEPFFEEMNGNKPNIAELPASNASSINGKNGNEDFPASSVSKPDKTTGTNGNKTNSEVVSENIEEVIEEGEGQAMPKGNATSENKTIPSETEGNVEEVVEEQEEVKQTSALKNNTPISTTNATGTEGSEEGLEEVPAAPTNASALPSLISNATESNENEKDTPTSELVTGNRTNLPETAPEGEEEIVDEEPMESIGVKGISNESISNNGNATETAPSSDKNATADQTPEESVEGPLSSTESKNETSDQSAEKPSDVSNTTDVDQNKTSEVEETEPSKQTEAGASNATETEASSGEIGTNATEAESSNATKMEETITRKKTDSENSFITENGEVIATKLKSNYIPSEGWWQGWNIIPKSFWIGSDFKAGNEFITLTNRRNVSISATPEGNITTTRKKNEISNLFLVEFIGQNTVNLRSYFGGYLSIAENGSVNSKSRIASPDTQFSILKTNRKCESDDPNYLFLRSNNGRFLTIKNSKVSGEQSVSNQALFKGVFWDENKSKCRAGDASGAEEAGIEGTTEVEESTEGPVKITSTRSSKSKRKKLVSKNARKSSDKISETSFCELIAGKQGNQTGKKKLPRKAKPDIKKLKAKNKSDCPYGKNKNLLIINIV